MGSPRPPGPTRAVMADGHPVPGPQGWRDAEARQRIALPLPERRRLVVVDAHGHAFRAFWALEAMHAPDGLPTNALYGLAGLLRRIVMEERPDYLAVVFDGHDEVRRTFRTALYPPYKAHRPERPADLAAQLPWLREVARALSLRTLEHDDFEADDCVATVVAMAEASGVETTILSADKDLFQLVTDRTHVWDAMRGKRYTEAGVREKFGVTPAMVADYLALCGDTSDNVPGVPGVGPKSASGLLRAYGSLEAIYQALEQLPTRERKKLDEHRERAFLSQSLTRLRADVPLGITLEDLRLPEARAELGAALWRRLGFVSFAPREDYGTRREAAPSAPVETARSAPVETARSAPVDAARSAPVDAARSAPVDASARSAPVETARSAPVGPIEVRDLAGLLAAVREARAALAFGLAMRGEAPRPAASRARAARPAPVIAPPVLGLALPTGQSWRISLAAAGGPVQGTLFADEVAGGLALADVAAALSSLLSDARRVLCVHDGRRVLPALGIGAARAVVDAAARSAGEPGEHDPAQSALEALATWLSA